MVTIDTRMKSCKCKLHTGDLLLPLSAFKANARYQDGLDYYCADCRRAADRARYARRKEEIKQRVGDWQKANAGKVNINSAAYRKRNAQKYKQANKAWRNNNPGLVAHLTNKRRAQQSLSTPMWVEEDLIKQLYVECPAGHHVHHIVPLQEDPLVCGLHCYANLVVVPLDKHNQLHASLSALRATYSLPRRSIIT